MENSPWTFFKNFPIWIPLYIANFESGLIWLGALYIVLKSVNNSFSSDSIKNITIIFEVLEILFHTGEAVNSGS
jgi:hypothetical protein